MHGLHTRDEYANENERSVKTNIFFTISQMAEEPLKEGFFTRRINLKTILLGRYLSTVPSTGPVQKPSLESVGNYLI